MSVKQIGYIRVSMLAQNNERQLDGITLEKMFCDETLSKNTKRPQLAAALEYLQRGDILVVHSMDRVAGNVEELHRIVQKLISKGVAVRFVKENLEITGFNSPTNTLILTPSKTFAEFERSLIRDRQREGVTRAKCHGYGRKKALNDNQIRELREKAANGQSKTALAAAFGISRKTLCQYLRESGQTVQAIKGIIAKPDKPVSIEDMRMVK